ncbi:hypothetical protein M758_4G078200 [Ceratodon purpureus]|nr:hypothetical protein M758_4G078200 [Ceratodon purpureus]
MGQAPSLEAAHRLIDRDFAGRLVFSHGLFHSPHPQGSYVLCQVDLIGEVPAKPRNDIGTEVVVQIIVLNEDEKRGPANFGKDEEIKEHGDTHGIANGGVSESIAEVESTTADTTEVQYVKEPSFEAWSKTDQHAYLAVKETGNDEVSDLVAESKIDAADKVEVQYKKEPSFEAWGKTDQHASLTEKEKGKDGVSELVAESKIDTADKVEVQYDRAPSFEAWGSANQGVSFAEQLVKEVILKLAPAVSIAPVSFDRLLSDIHKFIAESVSTSSMMNRDGVNVPFITPNGHNGHNVAKKSVGIGNKKHPNLVPVLGAYKGNGVLYIIFPRAPFSMESIMHFSPSAFGSDDHIRLLLFEMLAGLAHCHDLGIYHGNLRPWNILVINPTWCWLTGFGNSPRDPHVPQQAGKQKGITCDHSANNKIHVGSNSGGVVDPMGSGCNGHSKLQTPLAVDVGLSDYKGSNLLAEARFSNPKDWTGVFKRWWAGEVSNYDYLLLLNKLAGRRWGDECFHTVMPWVIDFSVKPDTSSSKGWRDLTKSKWRLAKGDEQLDFTYLNAEIPHHVSDECLSELAVCNYKARRLPLLLLRRIVRSVYEPNEYPSSMQRLYQWTPDECIPEFYSDPDVFRSIHSGMSNLAVPPWSQNADDFIQLHRAALESDRVSQQLHHWIDLTFGYKLSGQAAVDAKNVTLSSNPTVPRCSGRRQLFSVPHPRRREQLVSLESETYTKNHEPVNESDLAFKSGVRNRCYSLDDDALEDCSSSFVTVLNDRGILDRASNHLNQVAPLEELKESHLFAEKARHLSSCYAPLPVEPGKGRLLKARSEQFTNNLSLVSLLGLPNNDECAHWESSPLYKAHILASISSKDSLRLGDDLKDAESEDDSSLEDLVWWEALRQQGRPCLEAEGGDVFAAACIIAEMYLRRPLFDPVSMAAYEASGVLPDILEQLPPFVVSLIKPALHPDFQHRPSVEMLIKSPFFSTRIRAVYSFLASLHSLQSGHERLQFAADAAKFNAFQKLGTVATEMVAPSCLSLVIPFSSSIDPAAVVCLLKELLRTLKPHVAQQLVIPVIEHLLQSQEFPALQIALVQPPFVEDVHKILGTSAYLSYLHPLILSNLRRSPAGRLENATGAVLLSMCQRLGLPITLNQTLTPILLSFGRDVSVSGMDALLAIGERLGERVVVKHILPVARYIISMGLQLLSQNRVTPSQSLRHLAMVDAMAVLDRIIVLIPTSTILSELLKDSKNVYVKILLQPKLGQNLLQCAAKSLLLVCQRVGPEATAALVLPQLKPFFGEVAFAYEHSLGNSVPEVKRTGNSFSQQTPSSRPVALSVPAVDASGEDNSTSSERVGIVYILYPGFASLLGIEKLRQSLSTWLLLEQALLKHFSWKWGGSTSERPTFAETRIPKLDSHSNLVNPANLLLDGVRWSIPQSQSQQGKTPVNIRHPSLESTPDWTKDQESSPSNDEPWSWAPAIVDNFGSLEASSRGGLGMAKDEQPWKLSAVILHSVRVHSGGMRASAAMEDENTVFTAGGSGSESVVRQWNLSTSECCMEYDGHQEAVIDICLLPGNRVASCDGTLHIWSPQTGEQLAIFDESSTSTASTMITNLMSSSFETGRLPVRKSVDGTSSIGGLSANLTGGHVYTCLHPMEVEETIVMGTVNGSLRFFDMVEGRRLFLWRCELGDSYMSSYVSALSSFGQRSCNDLGTKCSLPSAWVAAGYSSGHCRLLDYRSGRVVMNWRAHDSSVTKLDVLDGNYLVSSSTDKTLRLWDLRRSAPTQLQTFRGHLDGVVSFALRGTDMLSAAGNMIGLSSLSKSPQSGLETQVIQPQRLYTAYQGSRSFSKIFSISVLPFSRLFLIGTEDGFLKVCS